MLCKLSLSFLCFLFLQVNSAATSIATKTSAKVTLESLLSETLSTSPNWTTSRWYWRHLDGEITAETRSLSANHRYISLYIRSLGQVLKCSFNMTVCLFPTGQDSNMLSRLNFFIPSVRKNRKHFYWWISTVQLNPAKPQLTRLLSVCQGPKWMGAAACSP